MVACIPDNSRHQAPNKNFPQRWGYLVHYSYIKPLERKKLLLKLPEYQVLCVTGFFLTSTGEITSDKNSLSLVAYINQSRNNFFLGRIYPLISFTSSRQGEIFLDSPAAWQTAARSLKLLMDSSFSAEKFPGIHLDFEFLSGSYNKKLAAFLKYLNEY